MTKQPPIIDKTLRIQALLLEAITFFVVLFTLSVAAHAQPRGTPGVQTAVAKTSTTAPYGYWEYLPADYDHTSPRKFGLMIFLHGAGEKGTGETGSAGLSKLVSQTAQWPTAYIARTTSPKSYPLIVLSPQCSDPVSGQTTHGPCSWWNGTRLRDFTNYALANYNVDPSRIYITGLSMGGGGTISLVRAIRTQVAAAIPVCGTENGSTTDANLSNIPLWFAHAINDSTVNWSSSRNLVNFITSETTTITDGSDYTDTSGPSSIPTGARNQTALYSLSSASHTWENLGTTTNVEHDKRLRFTIYKDGGHLVWSRVYSDTNMMNWLYMQRLNDTPQTCDLDINAGGAFDIKDAKTAMAWMMGFRGAALENFAGFNGTTATMIDTFLSTQKNAGSLDLDGDGIVSSTTDGLMLLRIALGFTDGTAITQKAMNPLGTRNTWTDVRNHLVNRCKLNLTN